MVYSLIRRIQQIPLNVKIFGEKPWKLWHCMNLTLMRVSHYWSQIVRLLLPLLLSWSSIRIIIIIIINITVLLSNLNHYHYDFFRFAFICLQCQFLVETSSFICKANQRTSKALNKKSILLLKQENAPHTYPINLCYSQVVTTTIFRSQQKKKTFNILYIMLDPISRGSNNYI